MDPEPAAVVEAPAVEGGGKGKGRGKAVGKAVAKAKPHVAYSVRGVTSRYSKQLQTFSIQIKSGQSNSIHRRSRSIRLQSIFNPSSITAPDQSNSIHIASNIIKPFPTDALNQF